MKPDTMRAPLIKSGAVLFVFILLAYLTSTSTEGSVLNSFGLMIIGAFRFVQWTFAMAIGLSVCIAFLIGIFLFAVSLVSKDKATPMYAAIKTSVISLLAPLFARLRSFSCHENPCAPSSDASPSLAPSIDPSQLKEDILSLVTEEMQKIAHSQQALQTQLTTLNAKMQALEDRCPTFAASGQLEELTHQMASSSTLLATVQTQAGSLEGQISQMGRQIEAMTAEKLLGDIPQRLQQIEDKNNVPGFDPQPLTDALQSLQKELEDLKKKPATPAKTKKKA